MPRSTGIAVQNNFSKGLNTESSGLNFPENFVQETDNCIFETSGIVRRRKGINFEASFVKNAITKSGYISEFQWKTAANQGQNVFAVIQVGSTIHFFEVGEAALSSTLKAFTVNLTAYKSNVSVSDTEVAQSRCEFAAGNGYLFVFHQKCNPIYVEYDSVADSITTNSIDLKVRDLDGIEENTDVDERPTTLTDEHRYNLRNQGWYADAIANGTGDTAVNVLDRWADVRDDYPSNSDTWWQYKDSGEQFNTTFIDRYAVGNTPAAKGHYIYSAFNLDRGVGTPETSGIFRPSCGAFFAGRVWYAGVNSGEYNSRIYFSRLAFKPKDFGKCYQENDPTSEILRDILANDGGVIVIPDMARCVKLFATDNSLLVFATNGVWQITGSEGIGFKATDYSVAKVADIGVFSASSFVAVEGVPFWGNADGLYTVVTNQSGTRYSVKNLSDDIIGTFWEEIPASSIEYMKAVYNKRDRVVQLLYRSTEASTFDDNFIYNRILNLQIGSGAFYPWTVDVSDVYLSGALVIQGIGSVTNEFDVADSDGLLLVTADGDSIVEDITSTQTISSVTKYIVFENDDLTFAEEYDTSFYDWADSDAGQKDYDSTFTSGYQIRGNLIRKQQTNYVLFLSEVETNSGFLFSGVFNYSTNTNSNKETTKQQGYLHNSNQSHSYRRLKCRGFGNVLQFKVESQAGKPFNIVGWVSLDSVNGTP